MTTVAFVGSMLGRHPGLVPNPAEELAPLLATVGVECRLVSPVRNPVGRAVDTLQTLARWSGDLDYAVVVTYSGRAFRQAQAASAVLRARRVPHAFYLKGGALPDFTACNPKLVSTVLRRADAVVAPSAYLEDLARGLGCRTVLIPNVFDLDRAPFGARSALRPRILWMRAFHPIYGPETAIAALADLRQRGIDAELTMAGSDKGSLDECRELIAELGLTDTVHLVGFVDDAAKPALFADHDLFVHTSTTDNTPVSVYEAMAHGLPVVGSDVGGMPAFVDGRATLVPPSAPKATADAIEELLGDAELAAERSRSGRELVERHSWDAIRPQWLALFDEGARRG